MRGRAGIVLIPGIERTIDRRHVLLLNFPAECAAVQSFADVKALKDRHPRGLVIAPHAFYPTPSALYSYADRFADLIDAVEVNSMFTRWLDFNSRAVRWARQHRKPVVGNTDLHVLEQMGTTYSLVEAEANADAICAAIRAGRVQVRSSALSMVRAGWLMSRMLLGGAIGRARASCAADRGARGGSGQNGRGEADGKQGGANDVAGGGGARGHHSACRAADARRAIVRPPRVDLLIAV